MKSKQLKSADVIFFFLLQELLILILCSLSLKLTPQAEFPHLHGDGTLTIRVPDRRYVAEASLSFLVSMVTGPVRQNTGHPLEPR